MNAPVRMAMVGLVLSLAACSDPTGPGDPRAAFEAARQRWQASGIVDYRMTVQRLCECLPAATRPVVVVVRGGEVAGVSDAETAEPLSAEAAAAFPSVDGLFELLAGFLDRGAEVQAVYDPTLGFPVQVVVDPVPAAADDELVFAISALEPGAEGDLLARLDAAARAWSEAGIFDYDMDLSRSCDCAPGFAGIVKLRVRGGAPVSITFAPLGAPVAEEQAAVYPTVSGLFDVVRDALDRGADALTVEYEPTLGVPVEVTIDYRSAIEGDEVEYQVMKLLQVAPGPQ